MCSPVLVLKKIEVPFSGEHKVRPYSPIVAGEFRIGHYIDKSKVFMI